MIFPIPVVHIWRVAIQLPGLTLLLGFWAALWLAAREARRIGLYEDGVYNTGFYAAVAGLVGARLWYVVAHREAFAGDPLSIIALNVSTLDATGGLTAGVLVGAAYAWSRRLISARWLDALAPGAALMLAAVSVSNLFSGDAYGTPSTLPWSIMLWDTERHPVQIYEMIALLAILVMVLIVLRRHTKPGNVALLFFACYAGQRVFLEAFRAESPLLPGGWRAVQLIGLIVLGVALIALARRSEQEPA